MNSEINYNIREWMDIVENETYKVSKEQKALVKHVKNCFKTEDIYTDSEQLERYLSLASYFPFEKLFPWQKFVIALHDCTYWKADGMPRWPDLFCMLGRGAGKDGTIAMESVALSSQYNGIREYDVDVCANNEEQAMRPVEDAISAFESPENEKKLKKHFYWTKERIKSLKTKSIIRGRTNSPKGKDGLRSGIVIFNEIHQYEDYKNINVFTTGLGKKKHPRRSYYTTNGDVREGPLDDLLDTSMEILNQEQPDNGLLPFICRLDAKEEVHDESNWCKANPSLPYLPNLMTETRKEYREWKENPRRLPAFMTKRMNIPENAEEDTVTDWDNIKATNIILPDLRRESCVAGVDYSKLTDFSSVNLHFLDGNRRYDINHSWLCLKSKDIPRMKCPWREWADKGYLTLVDENEISPDLIADYLDHMKSQYNIKKLAVDDFRFALLTNSLSNIGFDYKIKKNIKLVRPSDIMKVATVIDSCFANQYFAWGDDPVLRWATNNTKMVRYGRNIGKQDEDTGNYVYAKIEAKTRKTDPFMALAASMTLEGELNRKAKAGLKSMPVISI